MCNSWWKAAIHCLKRSGPCGGVNCGIIPKFSSKDQKDQCLGSSESTASRSPSSGLPPQFGRQSEDDMSCSSSRLYVKGEIFHSKNFRVRNPSLTTTLEKPCILITSFTKYSAIDIEVKGCFMGVK